MKARPNKDDDMRAGNDVMQRLNAAVRRMSRVLLWETLWPRLWLPAGVAGCFVVLSWLGLWELLPAWGRMAGVVLLATMFVLAFVPLLGVRWPTREAALRALDARGLGYYGATRAVDAPTPASTLTDSQVLGQSDPMSKALWELHRERAEAAFARLRVPPARPLTANFDRYALRGMVLVALVMAAFVAGPERGRRLALAFDWRGIGGGEAALARVDGWIDPPAYTRLPPVMLDFSTAGERVVSVPVGSTLVLRSAGQSAPLPAVEGTLEPLPVDAPAQAGFAEQRYNVAGPARLTIEATGGEAALALAVIPDHAPEIAFVGEPENNRRGGLSIAYRMRDDYGVTAARTFVTLPLATGRVLGQPPEIALQIPRGPISDKDGVQGRTVADVASHPWAGIEVRMMLIATDGAGQEGRSETLTFKLPERAFTNPLARALVEQRRNLVLNPVDWREVRTALRALMIAPDLFTPQSSTYLGLVTAENMLARARLDSELLDVADYLWGMALALEEGDTTDTRKALEAARQALQEAIDRGASAEEIARLTQELQQALNRHLAEMARQAARNGQQGENASNGQQRTITQEQLQSMIARMEQLAREGDMEGAQRLMEQLRSILDNLQMAQGGQGQSGQSAANSQAMRDVDGMIRDQQILRDDTYRSDLTQSEGQGQSLAQPGQNGSQGEQQGEGQPGGSSPGGAQGPSLAERQQALRRQLDNVQKQLRAQGLQDEPGFSAAERAMEDAGERLADGDGEGAVEAQGRALEAMLNGAQGLARQMQQAQQGNEGEGGQQEGEPGGDGQDPLGRSSRGRSWSDGGTRVPDAGESAVVRARRILDELRRRLGDPNRPQEERDYLERLLRRD